LLLPIAHSIALAAAVYPYSTEFFIHKKKIRVNDLGSQKTQNLVNIQNAHNFFS